MFVNSGIYHIFNTSNGKRYIGSSENLRKRLNDHKRKLLKGSHINKKLQNSWNKHGNSTFTFEALLLCEQEDLISNEQMFLDFYSKSELYNICLIAGNTKGRKHTQQSRKKISEKLKGNKFCLGNKLSEEHKAKIRNKSTGRVFSEESKAKISLAKKGKKNSEEHKRKVSEALKGKPINENARKNLRTPEAIEKARQKKLGRPLSEKHKEKLKIAFSKKEYREKRSIQMTGKKHSDEAKKKMSDFQKERNKLDRENGTVKTNSEETRQKIRDSLNTPEMKALLKQRWVERKKKQQQQKEENKENAD